MNFPRHDCATAKVFGVLAGAAALLALTVAVTPARAAFSEYGLESASASESASQAGSHPDLTLTFNLKTNPASPADPTGLHEVYARTKDLTVELPPGLVGNPNTVPKCTAQQFSSFVVGGPGCPQATQVGVTVLHLYGFNAALTEPIFNMEASNEDTVARLGYYAAVLPNFINVHVRSGSDYGLTATLEGLPANEGLVSATTSLWGVPAASSHDTKRLTPKEAYPELLQESPPRTSGLVPAPFLTNPASCEGPLTITVSADSYQEPGRLSSVGASLAGMTRCDKIEFEPSFSAVPTSHEAAAATGLDVKLIVPQNETVNGLGTSPLRAATVILPKGMTIAPGAADGLQACSAEEVGVGHDVAAACPEASKIGTADFDVPALARRLQGALYQRTPEAGNLFRVWLVADELGVHVKIGGDIRLDPSTGQVTSIFVDTPQVPVQELKLHFKSGSHGVLSNPPSCGTYSSHFEFTPWSSAVSVVGNTPLTIDQNCGAGGFSPGLSAGTVSPSAGTFSSFTLDVTRAGTEQNISGLSVTLPPGLVGKLAGIPLCSGAQAVTGGCGAASQIGTTSVAAGPGPAPLWIPQPGKDPTAVYLGGPYKGAPYSLIVRTPAQAGPFDLGIVVVRAAISVDPTTAQVTAKSDPLPQILQGVPISYRDIHVDVNRPGFVLNPTNCDPMSINAQLTSFSGTKATPLSRFQVGNCARLGFDPSLSLSVKGGTKRGSYQKLRAVLKAKKGQANIGRVSVALPHSEFLAQEHINTICTRVQFAADNCPKGSIYGHARAFTPLLSEPLEGPVYLRSSSHPLPDLVMALNGQIDIDLVGRIDSVNGGIRNTFDMVPDAPVTKFVLEMKGGKKSLLVNSRDLCAGDNKATVKMNGQNGKLHDFRPVLGTSCGKKK